MHGHVRVEDSCVGKVLYYLYVNLVDQTRVIRLALVLGGNPNSCIHGGNIGQLPDFSHSTETHALGHRSLCEGVLGTQAKVVASHLDPELALRGDAIHDSSRETFGSRLQSSNAAF